MGSFDYWSVLCHYPANSDTSMKANELRIGNLSKSKRGTILSFIGITPINQNLYWTNDSNSIINNNDIEPIPLTEEWVVRFGLKEKPNHTAFHIGDMQFDCKTMIGGFHDNEFGLHYQTKIHIKHVHQLQNLYFAITGNELKLNEI